MEQLDIRTGDILLYNDNKIPDKIIQWATHGPYNHIAVAINENQMIESVGIYGVIKSAIFKPDFIIAMNANISDEQIAKGISFITRRIGSSYGLLDIILDSFLVIAPKRFSHTPFLTAPSQFDCSHLVVMYLIVTGILVPDNWILQPQTISPNDIASYFR